MPTSVSATRSANPGPPPGRLAPRALQLLNRAALDAVKGHDSRCRAGVAEAGVLAPSAGLLSLDMAAEHILGLLELSTRNLPVALWHLTRCARMSGSRRGLDPYLVPFEPDLVEVLVALGRRTEAWLVAASLMLATERVPVPWSTVGAARCRGLLAGETTFEAEFVTALSLASLNDNLFERARTELCFGERLRRMRRRVDAREHLDRALEMFRSIGAAPWCERAATELQATSGTARRRKDPSTIDDLTPQEQHAAGLVAGGASIREAANRMFLSPKTVEAHLGRAYRKLGVHNRAQLAMTLGRRESGT